MSIFQKVISTFNFKTVIKSKDTNTNIKVLIKQSDDKQWMGFYLGFNGACQLLTIHEVIDEMITMIHNVCAQDNITAKELIEKLTNPVSSIYEDYEKEFEEITVINPIIIKTKLAIFEFRISNN